MRDISQKPRLLRSAVATARLVSDAATVATLRQNGDPLIVARTAAIQAAKNTSHLIPYRHSAPIEFATVDFDLDDAAVDIRVELKAIHRTGVEVEALAAASLAALTLYDLLEPVASGSMLIEAVTLARSKRGTSQAKPLAGFPIRAGILVLSDSVASGAKGDASGAAIRKRLEECGVAIERQEAVADEADRIAPVLHAWCDELHLDLIVTTGGTGLGPRDVTPEVIAGLIERRLPGVEEAMRAYGQERVPTAMLSRSVAGQRGGTVLIALPGSPGAVSESLNAIMPALLHAVPVTRGEGHQGHGYAKPPAA